MRIVFFLFNVKASGGGKIIVEIANGLSRRGHDILLIAPRGSISDRYPIETRVKEVGWAIRNNIVSLLINLPQMAFSNIKGSPGLVVSSFTIISYFSCLFAKLRGAKAVLFAQGYEPLLFDLNLLPNRLLLGLYRWLAKRSYSLPSLEIICNSGWTYDKICKARKAYPEKRIVPLSVDPSVYKPSESVASNDVLAISCIYKHQRIKGWHTIREAANRLHSRGENFRLLVMSPDPIVDSDLGLNCCFDLIYPSSDFEVANCYRASDLYINTSIYEGFGLPPLEAMACGVPVILTDSGGVREYVDDGSNCILIPPEDCDALVEAILTVARNNNVRGRLIANGLMTVQRRTTESMVSSFEMFLRDILEKK